MRSMTGFGAGEASTDEWKATVELSGVNRKQLDIAMGLPQSINALEPDIRKLISNEVTRGRINVRINLTSLSGGTNVLVVDESLAGQYLRATQSIAEKFELDCNITANELIRAPGLIKIEESQVEVADIEELVLTAVKNALASLAKMQIQEGSHLREDLEARIEAIESQITEVQGYSREVVEKYRDSLHSRLSESGLDNLDLNDERVLREIALFAERSDITEEITRIASHVAQFRNYFASKEPVGRALDFLCQELNRELNTIGSKANHASIAQSIVNSKTELEKIREQVQNVQ